MVEPTHTSPRLYPMRRIITHGKYQNSYSQYSFLNFDIMHS